MSQKKIKMADDFTWTNATFEIGWGIIYDKNKSRFKFKWNKDGTMTATLIKDKK